MRYKLLIIMLLGINILVAKSLFGDQTIVDEGLNKSPKKEQTKGMLVEDNLTISKEIIYLSKEQNSTISIRFKEVSQVPLYYQIIREKIVVYSSSHKSPKEPQKSRSLEFIVDESNLKIDDKIVIINRRGDVVKEIEVRLMNMLE